MIRGTFANIRLRNQLAPGTEGGWTRDFARPRGPVTTIYAASMHYGEADAPLVILAGKEYVLGIVTRLGGQGHCAAGRTRGDRRVL